MLLPENIKGKKIAFSSLNWGFGHLNRDIAILRKLISNQNQIFFAGNELQKKVLEKYFNTITFIELNDYPFEFKGKGRFGNDLIFKSKKLFRCLKNEKRKASSIVNKHQIDIIISDHRYGFYDENIDSILICHQINLPLKFWQKPFQLVHKYYLNKFKYWWIPDTAENHFAGKLSKTQSHKAIYLGPISRFESRSDKKENSCAIIASGPEIYAKQFLDNLNFSSLLDKYDTVFILAGFEVKISHPKLRVLDFFDCIENDKVLSQVSKIYSRSGYTTIMDLHFLKCAFELTATPGQAEQKYLEDLHKNKSLL